MVKSSFPPSLFDNDCDRPACADTVSALSAAMSHAKAKGTTIGTGSQSRKQQEVECPPSSSELGRGSWKLLHSMAAWYPDNPTDEDQSAMRGFITGLAKFYPCTYCAEDFRENLKSSPVRAESRTELSQWLCEQHNIVNEKLGKVPFSCNMKDLDGRWRISSAKECNGGGGSTASKQTKKRWTKMSS